jgi:hypothetical protein
MALILKRASVSRPSREWSEDDYDVLADGIVVGRIMKAAAGTPWLWTLAFGHHEDRTPTHGYEATREAAMAAFARVGGGSKSGMSAQPVGGGGRKVVADEAILQAAAVVAFSSAFSTITGVS